VAFLWRGKWQGGGRGGERRRKEAKIALVVTEAAAAAGSAVRMEGNVAVLRMGLCRELKAVTDGDGDSTRNQSRRSDIFLSYVFQF
jgi:hypothetical protein